MTPVCLSPLMRSARQQWGFESNGGYVTSDSDSVADAYQAHHFVKTAAEASWYARRLWRLAAAAAGSAARGAGAEGAGVPASRRADRAGV